MDVSLGRCRRIPGGRNEPGGGLEGVPSGIGVRCPPDEPFLKPDVALCVQKVSLHGPKPGAETEVPGRQNPRYQENLVHGRVPSRTTSELNLSSFHGFHGPMFAAVGGQGRRTGRGRSGRR